MGLYDKFAPTDLEEEAKRRQKLIDEMYAEEETEEETNEKDETNEEEKINNLGL